MMVSFVFPGAAPVTVGTASTLTYSIYRQMVPVRTVGRISPKGFARGGVTIAGTIIFTVINESFVSDLKKRVPYLAEYDRLRPDELPPFDIVVTFGNEYGQSASLILYGASFTDEAKTFSVEDIFTENVLTFIARDIRHMTEGADVRFQRSLAFRGNDEHVGKFKVEELLAWKEMQERQKRLEELKRIANERVQLPVMQPPAPPPPPPNYGTPRNGTPPSSGTKYGDILIRVVNASGQQLISGATVWFYDSSGKKRSGTTDKQGMVKFTNVLGGKTYKVYASHSGYRQGETSVAVKAGQINYGKIELIRVSGARNDPDARELVVQSRKVAPYHQAIVYELEREMSGDPDQRPKFQVFNGLGQPLSGILVNWSYVWLNPDDIPWYRKVMAPPKQGGIANTYTNGQGIATFPAFQFMQFPDGSLVRIIAKPVEKRGSNAFAPESTWGIWLFQIVD